MSSNDETTSAQPTGACRRRRFWKIPFIVAAVILIKSGLVMLLWNALIPDLFHGPILDFPQALGLTVLAKLLCGFGGGGFRHLAHRHGRHHWHHHKGKWANLTSEEREKLRSEVRKRCNWRD
jgi:hypothetical protein